MSIKDVFSFISKENIPCLLVGGLAVAAHGSTSSSPEIEFLIEKKNGEKVIACLNKLGYTTLQKIESFI